MSDHDKQMKPFDETKWNETFNPAKIKDFQKILNKKRIEIEQLEKDSCRYNSKVSKEDPYLLEAKMAELKNAVKETENMWKEMKLKMKELEAARNKNDLLRYKATILLEEVSKDKARLREADHNYQKIIKIAEYMVDHNKKSSYNDSLIIKTPTNDTSFSEAKFAPFKNEAADKNKLIMPSTSSKFQENIKNVWIEVDVQDSIVAAVELDSKKDNNKLVMPSTSSKFQENVKKVWTEVDVQDSIVAAVELDSKKDNNKLVMPSTSSKFQENVKKVWTEVDVQDSIVAAVELDSKKDNNKLVMPSTSSKFQENVKKVWTEVDVQDSIVAAVELDSKKDNNKLLMPSTSSKFQENVKKVWTEVDVQDSIVAAVELDSKMKVIPDMISKNETAFSYHKILKRKRSEIESLPKKQDYSKKHFINIIEMVKIGKKCTNRLLCEANINDLKETNIISGKAKSKTISADSDKTDGVKENEELDFSEWDNILLPPKKFEDNELDANNSMDVTSNTAAGEPLDLPNIEVDLTSVMEEKD